MTHDDGHSRQFYLAKRDAVAFLASLPDASVDLVITDPAYESLEEHRARGTTTRLARSAASSNDWFEIFPNSRFPALFAHVHRVLRPNRHFYLMSDFRTSLAVTPMAEAAGFRFWKPLVWDKVTIGLGYHYRARYELILFFEKGKRRLADLGVPDILRAKRVSGGYPAEKPVPLLRTLITQSYAPPQFFPPEQPTETTSFFPFAPAPSGKNPPQFFPLPHDTLRQNPPKW